MFSGFIILLLIQSMIHAIIPFLGCYFRISNFPAASRADHRPPAAVRPEIAGITSCTAILILKWFFFMSGFFEVL